MKRIRKTQATLDLPTLKLEGSLFLPDQLEKAAQGRASTQSEADYGIPKGIKLKDEYSRAKLFAAVDSRMKFCLITLGQAEAAEFVCFAEQVEQLADPRRRFTLTPDEFRLINPNTLT